MSAEAALLFGFKPLTEAPVACFVMALGTSRWVGEVLAADDAALFAALVALVRFLAGLVVSGALFSTAWTFATVPRRLDH